MTRLSFDPAFGWPWIVALGVLALAVAGFALWRGMRGWAWRGLAGLVLALALAGPSLERGTRAALSDIVILLDDRSASQNVAERTAQTDSALAGLERDLSALPNTEIRRVTVGDDEEGGSLIGTALTRALAAEPASRVAGIIAVTDGLAHDPAMIPAEAPAPVHILLTGQPGDWDRRLVVEEAPAFALIGKTATLRLRVQDEGNVPPDIKGRPLQLSIGLGDDAPVDYEVPTDRPLELPVMIEHAGQNVVSLSIDTQNGELTALNNAAAVQINGVRDRLRVLLVSGEPHAGERTWRNLLKSDAAVDLIHFTILRPPDKMDGVPVDELSLIAFPTRELFMERINDFDLIIFDRYRVRGILPPEYYDNIRRYVLGGGAVLISAGPELATVESLSLSPLAPILPARPGGRVFDAPFKPELTDEGRRHPVTAGLPGAEGADGPEWGRWLRQVQLAPNARGKVVMTGNDGQPLLILSREGEGRVALLGSDQVWLWGRGFEGGGPQLELLRRIAHWSMKEPDLEEEALTADILPGLNVRITRRTMQPAAGTVEITGPDGYAQQVELSETAPGRFSANWAAPAPGLYRLTEGEISRVIALGPAAPREFQRIVASGEMLEPLTDVTGGSIQRLSDGQPAIRTVAQGATSYGRNLNGPWIGITPRDVSTIAGLARNPVLPDWGWLILIAMLIVAGWLSEGRRRI